MRLHHLRVTAFQAFAESEEVDFDALGDAGLFLLHGETGAGKTTLLDAVCFALYGELPGARAREARVRSDHADPALRTEVELEATLRGRRLRIVRRPRQERPKLRGEGMTEEAHACTVEALGEGDGGGWTVLAARPEEARAELADLLGMSCEQFCQVVLLPQGEFATFLRADSGERQAVLERLFGTDRFARVEGWLAERRKAAGSELRGALDGVRDVVSRLSEVGGEPMPEAWEEEPAELRAWADRLGVTAEAQAATAASARAGAAQARAAAEAELAAGTALAERRARRAAAVEELVRWERRAPERAAAEAELAAAHRAAPVAALLAAAASAKEAADRARERAAGSGTRTGGAESSGSDPAGLRTRAAELRGEAGGLDALVEVEERLARGEAELAALAAQAEEADGIAARARAAHAAERDRLAAERAVARDALRAATDAEQQTHAAWLDVRERRLAGMAAELAAGLEPGEPCAVCGAREHPAPAHADAPPDGVPLAEHERAAQAAHAQAAEIRAAAERRLAATDAALAAAVAVAGAASAETERAAGTADERARATDALLAAPGAAADPAATGAERLEAFERTRRDAEQRAERARAAHAERAAALAADRARVATARGGAESVAARAAALRAEADAADEAAAALEDATRAEASHAEAEKAADQAARAAGFPDAAAAAAAVRDAPVRDDLERRLRAYDDGLAERRARAQDPALAAAAGEPAPDLPALEARADAACAADDEATAADARAAQRLDALARLAAQLDTRLSELAPIAERERWIRELAFLVDGTAASNRLRMRLSAYVLAARLEEVAEAASVRLERMSNGRFRLVHTDERARGERRGGLELRVLDGWTGRERAPATLSGGETFLASLALALGLADVVAAEAGGSRLETLFVDEGFGSLDERTLDEVLDVLDALREGGRAVGIVSHVAELRQRIPARLHVVKGRSGSHVEQRAAPLAA